MCRHLAYLGPPTPVGALLTHGPHSLRTQSWAPREMRGGGTINADGFGVAWWHHPDAATPDHGPGVIWHGGAPQDVRTAAEGGSSQAPGPGPVAGGTVPESSETTSAAGDLVVSRYRNSAPIWTDPAVDEVLPQIHATAVLAAIRSATVGMPVERSACAPFTHGRWAFSHNGAIPDWRRVLAEVAAEFGSLSLLDAESLTDSAALWVILRGLLDGPGRTARPEAGDVPGKSGAAESGGAGARSRAESQGFSSSVAFGSSVTVTSTSGAPPEVRAWGWTTTAETGGAGAAADVPVAPVRESRRGAGAPSAEGMDPGEALRRVSAAVLARSPKARLNLLLGDGVGVWATTWHHALSVLETGEFVVVASEPYDDDPRWRAIADRQLVRVRGGRVAVEPLDIEIGRAGS